MSASLQVVINGEKHAFAHALSVRELLEALHLADRRVAVELNGAVVPRSRHAVVALSEGDELLIVQAIGGG